MTTRTQFFETGLTPCNILPERDNTNCSICQSGCTSPVTLRCHHIFDKSCIEQWLTMRGRNTCPICKSILFTLPPNEDINFGREHRAQIGQALRLSGLSQSGALSTMDAFGGASPSITMLQRAVPGVSAYLAERLTVPGLIPSSGLGIIRTDILLRHFVVIGNLVPALATVQGRHYNEQDAADWHLVLSHTWSFLQSQNGRTIDVDSFVVLMRKEVRKRLDGHFNDAGKISCLFQYADPAEPNPCFDDLQVVLEYVTFLCYRRYEGEAQLGVRRKEEKEERERKKAACFELKMRSLCGVM
ncbi:hypothetical protein LTR09_005750 [Extremus antarcticus]|uniref:RING-type domain-containing protein n=1 Tax=Extremus antarcticus TaxID=702011 RepID=A0AAJ0DMP7_9PEZI|nr:hypothetical protein LTR09_005750 [Extremus antarcticus]